MKTNPYEEQVGGSHYIGLDPMRIALKHNLNPAEKDVIKYVTRRKGDKDCRIKDLNKAIHVIRLLIWSIENGECD